MAFQPDYPFVKLSPRAEELRKKLLQFVDEECIPAEELLEKQLGAGKKGSNARFAAWPPILDELAAKARSLGLWNLFLPPHYEDVPSPGLNNLEYAVICEILGRSQNVAPIVTNCNAPDTGNIGRALGRLASVADHHSVSTGNMELLAKYGTPEQKKKWLIPLVSCS